MILEFTTLIVIVVVLALIILFLYIKDKQLIQDLGILQESLLELKTNKLQSDTPKYEENSKKYQELDAKIYELGESLIKIVRSIKSIDQNQKDITQRVAKIEEQLKLSMLSSSSNLSEKEIILLYKDGKTAEEIAKEKNIPLGEVEFIIKIANLNDN